MPGTFAITCKAPQDLRDAIHQMATAQQLSVNQFVFNILQSYVLTGKADSLPSVSYSNTPNSRQLAMQQLDSSAPALIKILLDKAQAGDRESAIYCLDRLMGKPRQQVDQRTITANLTGEEFARLLDQARCVSQAQSQALLNNGYPQGVSLGTEGTENAGETQAIPHTLGTDTPL